MSDRNRERNTGKGVDRKGTKKDGLRFRWLWVQVRERSWPDPNDPRRHSKKREPCQSCEAILPTTIPEHGFFTLKAISWYDDYEARVSWAGEGIASSQGHKTRLEAQIVAEALLLKFLREGLKLFKDA